MSSSGNSPHGNRRIDYPFTASLATIDSGTPTDEEPGRHAGTWDTEADHILSYFLGGAESQGPPTADFASSTTSSNASTLTAAFHPETDARTNGEESISLLPPTPAVQFFANHSSSNSQHQRPQQPPQPTQHQQHPSIAPSGSMSSSSSSLSSMAAALVSGVPPGMLHGSHLYSSTHPTSRPSPSETAEMSPVSPAALIGNGQENLLLPGPDSSVQQQQRPAGGSTSMGPPAPREPKAWPVPLLPNSTPAYYHWMGVLANSASAVPNPPESEEKRAKRLERNRVSARKSRRKKKERLESLSQTVNQLHDTVEHKRRDIITAMVPAFMELRAAVSLETVQAVLDLTSPHSDVQRAVLEFQYAQLKNMTLPGYQKLLLWLTLQQPRFFTAGKEGYTDRPLGKVSSKQIGEELAKSPAAHKVGCDDISRWWPLFCFELRFSVDQEERLIRSVSTNAQQQRLTMAQAVETTDRLSQAVNSLSHLVARREEKTFALLSNEQVVKLQRWKSSSSGPKVSIPKNPATASAVALHDICEQLNRVLQISASPPEV